MRLPRQRTGILRTAAGFLLLAAAACERDTPSSPPFPPSATKRASPPARATPALVPSVPDAASIRLPPGADDRDAPNAPAILPRSYDMAGWIKHEPVRVALPNELALLIADDGVRAAMESFLLKSVAHCVYRYAPPDTTAPLLLDVLWVQALDSDDAFGLFSVLAAPPRGLNADGSQTAERRDSDNTFRLFGWQGTVCMQMTVLSDDSRATLAAAARLLRAKLLFSVPRADPPELLRRLPREQLLPEREWLVRKAVALQLPGAAELPAVAPQALDAVLGLDGDVLLAIAAYEVAPGETPNYVWVAQYPEPATAAEAIERYQARLDQPGDDVDRNTMLAGPRQRYIAGTWTADQESVQHLLPRLLATLPQ